MIKEVVKDKLYVSDEGRVYSDENGKNELKIYFSGRNKDRPQVSVMIDGKQIRFYINKIVAEAFVDNPENKPLARYIDGDTKNNKASNFEWVTQKELVQHIHNSGKWDYHVNSTSCSVCGEPTKLKDSLCYSCKLQAEREEAIKHNQDKIDYELGKIDMDSVTDRQREYIVLRSQYYTYEEIAEITGVSKQCVEGAIKRVIKRDTSLIVHNDKREIVKKIQELNNKKAKLENFKLEIDILEAEIQKLERDVESMKEELIAS